jgi:heptosyltransferase-2
MRFLIIKLGASGDVIRTTVLLHFLDGEVDWLTSELNRELVAGLPKVNVVTWNERDRLKGRTYDLAINLEDSAEAAAVLQDVRFGDLYGAYLDNAGTVTYTGNAAGWFDLGIISRFGIEQANILKLRNRDTFQSLVCWGLGHEFRGEPYLMPPVPASGISGDVAVAPEAGRVWPMKNWALYDELIAHLRRDGLVVNVLPKRTTMLEHVADIRSHGLLVSGDSLPMHCALGSNVHCITLFICTSPWEIHGYGIQEKIVSTDLDKYFYRRDYDEQAVRSIPLATVHERALAILERARHPAAS